MCGRSEWPVYSETVERRYPGAAPQSLSFGRRDVYANPQKGAKPIRRRLVLRGGCLYAYRDVNKSLGGKDTPELSS